MAETTNIRIFFSWQSDLPKDTTTNAIREVLTVAANEIEDILTDIKINIEEATSNVPGSPDIPALIFDRISISDIIISDITTINARAGETRKTANPNVLIELGFALSQLGWERVILLFNEHHGSFPNDVSFDIDRRRIGKYKVTSKGDRSGKGQLKSLLIAAISLIITDNPQKPFEKKALSSSQQKRLLDITNLKRIIGTLNIPIIERHIQMSPEYIDTRILHFYESFKGTFESIQFFLYDHKSKSYLKSILKHWSDSLSSDTYRDTSDPHMQKFGYAQHLPISLSEKDKREYEKMMKAVRGLKLTLSKFFDYVRQNYLELDLDELSQHAYDEWIKYQGK